MGAICALLTALLLPQMPALVVLRTLTGVTLAGIYPVGMKIVAGWYTRGLGAAIIGTRRAGSPASWGAAGAPGCVMGGQLVRRYGSARVAATQLAASGLCCLAVPWMLRAHDLVFAIWLIIWGATVIGDSPQLSALTANNAPRDAVGSVPTLSNCIGFAISIVSTELFVRLAQAYSLGALLPWLGIGPLLGLAALMLLLRRP